MGEYFDTMNLRKKMAILAHNSRGIQSSLAGKHGIWQGDTVTEAGAWLVTLYPHPGCRAKEVGASRPTSSDPLLPKSNS